LACAAILPKASGSLTAVSDPDAFGKIAAQAKAALEA